jgi:hypothetical protein
VRVEGTIMRWLWQGENIYLSSGSIEFGGRWGTSWEPLPGSPGITAVGPGSYFLRGDGWAVVCEPEPTPTPTTTTPRPEPEDECNTPDGYINVLNQNGISLSGVLMGSASYEQTIDVYAQYGSQYDAIHVRFDQITQNNANPGNYTTWGIPMHLIAWDQLVPAYRKYLEYTDEIPELPSSNSVYLKLVAQYADDVVYNVHVCVDVRLVSPTATPTHVPSEAPDPKPTSTPPGPTRTPMRPEPMIRTATPTPTLTPYPTSVAQCAQSRIAPGMTMPVSLAAGAFIRTLNGSAVGEGTLAAYTIDQDGMIWPEATGNYAITAISISDGGANLVVEICPLGPGSFPTATRTATPPALPCAIAERIAVPVSPRKAILLLQTGTRFVVTDASIFLNIGSDAREVLPGNYEWSLGPGYYDAYSQTVPATVWICASASAPTWTPGVVPVETAACVPRTATATRPSYAMPDLSFVIPARASSTATMTTTALIDVTALVALHQSAQAGIETPAGAIATMTGGFSWGAGESTGQTALAVAQPALNWMAGSAHSLHPPGLT